MRLCVVNISCCDILSTLCVTGYSRGIVLDFELSALDLIPVLTIKLSD